MRILTLALRRLAASLPTLLLIEQGQPTSRAPAQPSVDNLLAWLNGALAS